MMKSETLISNARLSILIILLIMFFSQGVHALSAKEVCEQPIFKLWKKQQANRLWTPSDETLLAEKAGKLFVYNCFTFEDIDQFFSSHSERIENAHFYPILEIERKKLTDVSEDEDC